MRPGSEGWTRLPAAGVSACALRVAERDIAYWKNLFESYEGLAIVRTVENLAGGFAVIALLATPEMVAEAEAVIVDVQREDATGFERVDLPGVVRADWFLAEWTREETGR